MTSTILIAFLAVALAAAVAAGTYRAFAGVRARRRAAWEVDRALWRQWIHSSVAGPHLPITPFGKE
jgi:hypothetical protein